MPQESNFYRLYKLAYKDRTQALKSLILGSIIVCALSFSSLLTLGAINSLNLKVLLGAAITWLIAFALLPIFFLAATKTHFYLFEILFGAALFIPLFLSQGWNFTFLYLACGAMIGFLMAGWRMKGEAEQLIDLNFSRIISQGIIYLSLIIVFVFGLFIYFERDNLKVAQEQMKNLSPLVAEITTKLNWNISVDELLSRYLQMQLETNQFSSLSAASKQLLLRQTRAMLSQSLGIPLSGKESVITVLIDYVKTYFTKLSPSLKIVFYLVLASTVWSFITFFNYFFFSLIVILSWLLLKFLVLIKFIEIKRIGVEKEEIVLA